VNAEEEEEDCSGRWRGGGGGEKAFATASYTLKTEVLMNPTP
jgi:hypothetical protein